MTKSTITREQLHERARENVKALKFASRQTAFESAREEILADLQLAELALAAMDSEPVAYTDERNLSYIDRGRETAYLWGKQNSEASDVALYRHAQPAPAVPDEMYWQDAPVEGSTRAAAYASGWNACRAAMLQAESVTTADKLPELIEGMEVSIDVSTCDADAGNRYFGTVAELSELDGAKNGYILLVQDAKPNFNQSSNSPVIQDGSEHCPCCGKKLRRACSVERCGGKHVAHGLCQKHYDMKRWEDPEQVRKFREAGKRYRRKTKSAAAAPQEVKSES